MCSESRIMAIAPGRNKMPSIPQIMGSFLEMAKWQQPQTQIEPRMSNSPVGNNRFGAERCLRNRAKAKRKAVASNNMAQRPWINSLR